MSWKLRGVVVTFWVPHFVGVNSSKSSQQRPTSKVGWWLGSEGRKVKEVFVYFHLLFGTPWPPKPLPRKMPCIDTHAHARFTSLNTRTHTPTTYIWLMCIANKIRIDLLILYCQIGPSRFLLSCLFSRSKNIFSNYKTS